MSERASAPIAAPMPRERALYALYEASVKGIEPGQVLPLRWWLPTS